jgi:hypothetical protein
MMTLFCPKPFRLLFEKRKKEEGEITKVTTEAISFTLKPSCLSAEFA